jgi:hypothetical protein
LYFHPLGERHFGWIPQRPDLRGEASAPDRVQAGVGAPL